MEPGSAHCCTKGLEQEVQWLRTKAVVPKGCGAQVQRDLDLSPGSTWASGLTSLNPNCHKFEEDGDHTPSYEIVMRCNEINGYI